MDLQTVIEQTSERCDLVEEIDNRRLYDLVQTLLEVSHLPLAEVQHAALLPQTPLEFRIAAKLYESRHFMLINPRRCTVGVVFALWGEQNRLRPRSDENPNGEDALRRKVEQLAWITAGTPIDWTLYAVDDGCPHGSGHLAQRIVQDLPQADKIKVLFLEDAMERGPAVLRTLRSVDESKKGGAVILGCQQAIRDGMDLVIYTDADCSVHLGQIGLLLQRYLVNGTPIVLGNRKAPGAVLIKEEGRWGIGIKVLRHMQRMVGSVIFARGIMDTQAAFKLYESRTLMQILDRASVVDFSFDSDWILAAIALGARFDTVPFAFIDSFAESASITQGPMTTWETLLKGLVKSVRVHGLPHNREMAEVIDQEITSSKDLECLIDHLPAELVHASPEQLGDPELMSPGAVRRWIRARKSSLSQ